MFGDKCRRCQKGDEDRVMSLRHTRLANLVGDFSTVLCPECVNDWTQRIWDDDDFLEYSAALIQQRCAIAGDRSPDATNMEGRILALRRILFAAAKQFVAEDVTREEPDEVTPK